MVKRSQCAEFSFEKFCLACQGGGLMGLYELLHWAIFGSQVFDFYIKHLTKCFRARRKIRQNSVVLTKSNITFNFKHFKLLS